MLNKIYCGIGSRKTPENILTIMSNLGLAFQSQGYILRSGGAGGADQAFSKRVLPENKEIYIPWGKPEYNSGEVLVTGEHQEAALALAATVHPAWERCSWGAKLLHTRNCYQILGPYLNDPVQFVVYWAPEDEYGKVSGGTATAVTLARMNNIPTYNLLFQRNRELSEKIIRDGTTNGLQ